MANHRLLATLARRGGGKLLDLAVGKVLPVSKEEKVPLHKRSLTKGLAGAAITRIATRSVPGAIVVGGGILAKTLYDRRRKRRTAAKPDKQDDA